MGIGCDLFELMKKLWRGRGVSPVVRVLSIATLPDAA
jgi:hypothetical protein